MYNSFELRRLFFDIFNWTEQNQNALTEFMMSVEKMFLIFQTRKIKTYVAPLGSFFKSFIWNCSFFLVILLSYAWWTSNFNTLPHPCSSLPSSQSLSRSHSHRFGIHCPLLHACSLPEQVLWAASNLIEC